MDLELARKVLEVSEAQPFDFVKLRGRGIAREVEEMESAGLLVLSAAQGDQPDAAVIKGVTGPGRLLLKILRDKTTARYLKRARRALKATARPMDLEMAVL